MHRKCMLNCCCNCYTAGQHTSARQLSAAIEISFEWLAQFSYNWINSLVPRLGKACHAQQSLGGGRGPSVRPLLWGCPASLLPTLCAELQAKLTAYHAVCRAMGMEGMVTAMAAQPRSPKPFLSLTSGRLRRITETTCPCSTHPSPTYMAKVGRNHGSCCTRSWLRNVVVQNCDLGVLLGWYTSSANNVLHALQRTASVNIQQQCRRAWTVQKCSCHTVPPLTQSMCVHALHALFSNRCRWCAQA